MFSRNLVEKLVSSGDPFVPKGKSLRESKAERFTREEGSQIAIRMDLAEAFEINGKCWRRPAYDRWTITMNLVVGEKSIPPDGLKDCRHFSRSC